MSDVAISLRGLVKVYRSGVGSARTEVRAIDGLDLEVRRGTVHALLGPNGAGKTTTVRVIATLLAPDAGSATVLGLDAVREASALRRVIGVSGQYAAVDGNLTAFENLRLVGRLYGMSWDAASARARELITMFGLEEVADRPTRTSSGGTRRRVDLAGALVAEPDLVVLDEPTTGLDPRARRGMWATISDLVARGTTVLLTTQYLEEADALADRITVIDRGAVVADGSAAELKSLIAGATVTVRVAPGAERASVVAAFAGVGASSVHDGAAGEYYARVDDGTRSAAAVVSALAVAGVAVEDVVVNTPTLDDVFLHLTERTASA